MTIDIQEINKKLSEQKRKQKIQKAFQDYNQEFNSYQERCTHAICDYLESCSTIHSEELRYCHFVQARNEFKSRYTIFSNFNLFALTNNHQIFCLKNMNLIFNKSNYQKIFDQYGYYPPQIELIDRLYEVLSLRRDSGPYWKYIHYKYQNHCNNCIFDLLECFSIIDGNILFSSKQLSSGGILLANDHDKTLLYDKTYKMPIYWNNRYADPTNNMLFTKCKQPTINQIKAIVKWFRDPEKYVTKEYIDKPAEQVLLELIINHLQQNDHISKLLPIIPEYTEAQVSIIGEPKNILEARQKCQLTLLHNWQC